jgi:hypothetical protein
MLLGEREMCDIFNIHSAELSRRVSSGELPPPAIKTGEWRWAKTAVDEMLKVLTGEEQLRALKAKLLFLHDEYARTHHEARQYASMVCRREGYLKSSHDDYLNVPLPFCKVTTLCAPKAPGIYFFFENGDSLAYVGQSINLSKRVAPSHEHCHTGDAVSWIICDANDLFFTEAFYIGSKRPYRNYTKRDDVTGRAYYPSRVTL